MRTGRILSTALVLTMIATACGDSGDADAVDSREYEAFRSQPTACGSDRPPPATAMSFEAPEDLALSGVITATLHTSCGDITIQLFPEVAPQTVNSFVFLAERGYFDGTVSHRIVPGFVIQMGDPTATGRGGPGYAIPDELPPEGFSYDAGIVAMANAGPNTGGSQFFIVLGPTSLGPDFSVFATVSSGAAAITAIASVPVTTSPGGFEQSHPTETVYIESITIER